MQEQVVTVVAPETDAPIVRELPVSDAAAEPVAATPEPTPAPTPDPFEARFKRAAEAEKKARAEREALTARQKELRDYEEWQRARNAAPLDKLKFLGVSYEDLTNEVIKGGKVGVEAQVDEVGHELRTLKQQLEQERAELARAQERQLYAAYEQDLQSHAKSNPAYELTARLGDPAVMRQISESHFQATGEIPSHDEVCAQYEQQLTDLVRKLKGSPKLRELLADQATVTPPRATQAPRTITNNLSASASANDSIDDLPFEEKKRLIARSLRASVE